MSAGIARLQVRGVLPSATKKMSNVVSMYNMISLMASRVRLPVGKAVMVSDA